MKKIYAFLLLALCGQWGVAQGQNGMITFARSDVSTLTDPQMAANAHYLGSEGQGPIGVMDWWVTQSEKGARGFAKDKDWQVVKTNWHLSPQKRVDLRRTHECSYLASAMDDSTATVLLVDSSESKEAAIYRAKVRLESGESHIDTLCKFNFTRKDKFIAWGAVSPNGKYMGMLTVMQYVKKGEYKAEATVFDNSGKVVWTREYGVGTTWNIYVTDKGEMLTLGVEHGREEEHFIVNVMNNHSGDTYDLKVKSDPVLTMRIANVQDGKMLCLGTFMPADEDPDDELTGGMVSMSFSLDSLFMKGFTMRPFMNEDVNILMNKKTKKVQRTQMVEMIEPIAVIPTPYGGLIAMGHRHKLSYTNANGTRTSTYLKQGIHMVAVDMNGTVKWVRNVRRCDVSRNDDLLYMALFAEGNTVCLVKNEERKYPDTYDIAKEAREYEVGDKGRLVIYRIKENGEVKKDIIEKKTEHMIVNSTKRADGTTLLLSVDGRDTRKMELTFE